MSKATEYRPNEYWEELLRRRFDLRDVGWPNLSISFNICLYRGMLDSMERGLKIVGLTSNEMSKLSILDVGCGTGFWIDFWQSKGAKQISGIDLTAGSVAHLSQKYPELEFKQKDIADPIDSSEVNAYDIISAMHIVHHIPSQQRWEQALMNLGFMLKPGGYLIIMDPILRYRWWGKPFDLSSNGRPRTVAQHMTVLKQAGITTTQALIPTVAILANPVDTKLKLAFLLLNGWWRLFDQVASRERLMRSTSWLVYPLDRLLCRLNYMPSSKVMICRKELSPANMIE